MMTRRNTLLGAGALTATLTGVVAGLRGLFGSAPAEAAQAAHTFEVTHTEAEWKKLLKSATPFQATRKKLFNCRRRCSR